MGQGTQGKTTSPGRTKKEGTENWRGEYNKQSLKCEKVGIG